MKNVTIYVTNDDENETIYPISLEHQVQAKESVNVFIKYDKIGSFFGNLTVIRTLSLCTYT